MSYLLKKTGSQSDLGAVIDNIVKINNLISKASQKSNDYGPTDCARGDEILSPCFALTIVDENVEEDILSDSDIDLLMLIGEGFTHQEISSVFGIDTTQVSKWRDEIVRKAKHTELPTN